MFCWTGHPDGAGQGRTLTDQSIRHAKMRSPLWASVAPPRVTLFDGWSRTQPEYPICGLFWRQCLGFSLEFLAISCGVVARATQLRKTSVLQTFLLLHYFLYFVILVFIFTQPNIFKNRNKIQKISLKIPVLRIWTILDEIGGSCA